MDLLNAPRLSLLALVLSLAWPDLASAADWPMWRYDAQRRNASPQDLPESLQQHWVRELPALKPAWPDQPKMQFDAAYEPIVSGGLLFVASSHDDSVAAYSTSSGEQQWKFLADGPVRFAPLAGKEKLYFSSDDGYLYCLDAASGRLRWKFRGGPSDRKILGNQRLISTWPARGAPVLADGTIYFAAGIWPFMGIFLHAVDAETGRAVWTNDGDGSMYIKQPHNSDSFAGVAPQGPLVAVGDKLLVPSGRSVPACYDRRNGEFLYYELAENGKRGGSAVAASDQLLFNGGAAFDLNTEKYLGTVGELLSFTDEVLYHYASGDVRLLDLEASKLEVVETVDRKGAKVKAGKWKIQELGEIDTPRLTALIKAGSRLYAGAEGEILALDASLRDGKKSPIVWQQAIEGTPVSLVAAEDRLFVSTLQGRLYCFGDRDDAPSEVVVHRFEPKPAATSEAATAAAKQLLEATKVLEGYCLAFGASAELIAEVVWQSDLNIVAIQADAKRVDQTRRKLLETGIPCERASVLMGNIDSLELPPYLASLIVVADAGSLSETMSPESLAKLYACLRPYGGVACLNLPAAEQARFEKVVKTAALPGAKLRTSGDRLLLSREGALPGSANWTHEHADAANTRVSKDAVVKAPLGLLWFGGPSNDGILPRHGHGPQPQVVDGRLFIEGVDMLRAVDIYTGRLLWETSLPGVGAFFDNTAHQPGANASGTNYIATVDGIYVAYGERCLRLDPANGKQVSEFKLPADEDSAEPMWGYINVFEDYLVAGAEPLAEAASADEKDDRAQKTPAAPNFLSSLVNKALKLDNDNLSSSRRLVVMDRHTGRVLWSVDSQCGGFRHNAICIGGGRLYAIDRMSGAQLSRLKRRGESPPEEPRLLAFDLKSGRPLWSRDKEIFGTWLSYSTEHDVLVEAGRTARDTLRDEPTGMRAWQAAKGESLWHERGFLGPAMIRGDEVLMAGSACNLLTGEIKMREDPLTGELVPWTWTRNYGCNTPMASEHLLTFRSGAAGYYDFCNDGGTGNLGGFRSSCTNNLVVAGGVLSAPDYTRSCTCSYQNQTSLALVHLPEAEMWTSFSSPAPRQAVRRLGLNLGAPGDRRDEGGTLWLDYPSVGGTSPAVSVEIEPKEVSWFRRHSSHISGPGLAWVAASGVEELTSLKVTLDKSASKDDEGDDDDLALRKYTVRLHFMEPDDLSEGQRVFEVALGGQQVLSRFDIVHEAGGAQRAIVKEFRSVPVARDLEVTFTPSAGSRRGAVLSGIEVQAEGW